MQTTETTTDVVTAARATIFARMIHGLTADGDARPAFEQAKGPRKNNFLEVLIVSL